MFLLTFLVGLTFSFASVTQKFGASHSKKIIDLFNEWEVKGYEKCNLYPAKKYNKFYQTILKTDMGKESAINQKLQDLIFPFSSIDLEKHQLFEKMINFISDYLRDCQTVRCRMYRGIKSAAILSPLLVNSTESFVEELKNYFDAAGLMKTKEEKIEFGKALRYFKYKYFCDLGGKRARRSFFDDKENAIDYRHFSYFYQKFQKSKGKKFSKLEKDGINDFINGLLKI